jgi:hypothetical protein
MRKKQEEVFIGYGSHLNIQTAHLVTLLDTLTVMDGNKTIELNPDFGEAYNNRAIIYLNKNELENACKDLKSAQKLGIKNADSLILKYCNSN